MSVLLPLLAALSAGLCAHAALPFAPGAANAARGFAARVAERRARGGPGRFRDLPDFLELLALALSCGHPLSSAWPVAVRFMPPGLLRRDLEAASAALRYGRSPDRCLADLAVRVGDPRAGMALALIAQALVMGNTLEDALLGQASSLRRLRLLDVERRAQTAPLRMMLPVMALILPAVMIVLLGPIVLQIMSGGLFS